MTPLLATGRLYVAIGCMGLATSCVRPARPSLVTREEYLRAQTDSVAPIKAALFQALPEYEHRWTANGPANYQFRLRRSCYCVEQPVTEVTVSGGTVTEVRDTTGAMLPDTTWRRYAYTVPELFALIRRDIGSDVWSVSAEFDQRFGFPSHIVVENLEITDAGEHLDVTDFTELTTVP